MILIADSGSTKTDWVIVTSTAQPVVINTQGINPVHQSREQIVSIIRDEFQNRVGAEAVYFYGSGIRPEMEKTMRDILEEMFPQAMTVEVHSDLLGAARALCGHEYGIASILGTGANSCLYDGEKIVEHTPALGYILGDECSGAALGKRFLHDLYGGKLSEEIRLLSKRICTLIWPKSSIVCIVSLWLIVSWHRSLFLSAIIARIRVCMRYWSITLSTSSIITLRLIIVAICLYLLSVASPGIIRKSYKRQLSEQALL